MTKKQIGQKYRAWKAAKDEAWKAAWAFADAVAEYAAEKPRGYAQEIAAETGLDADYIGQIKRTAAAYPVSRPDSRNPAASFRAHMEFARSGRGGEWVPDGTTLRDVAVPEKSVAKQLAELPPEKAAVVISEALDTPEIIEAVDANEEAADHIFNATTALAGSRGKSGGKKNRKLEEMTVVLSLIGVLGQIRDLAKEDSDSPLIKECKNLMRETLEILDGIEEADDPDTVEKMLSDFGEFLASH